MDVKLVAKTRIFGRPKTIIRCLIRKYQSNHKGTRMLKLSQVICKRKRSQVVK